MRKYLHSLNILPRWIILLLDLLVLSLSLNLAYLLRFNFELTEVLRHGLAVGILFYALCNFFAILVTQSYAGIIRYTSLQDGLRVLKMLCLGTVIALLVNYQYYLFFNKVIIPHSIILISFFVGAIALFCYRLLVKYVFLNYTSIVKNKVNVLILGAGQSGMVTHQIIAHDLGSNLRVVGFLENDDRKVGKLVNGTKIFHADDLEELIKVYGIKKLIFAVQDIALEKKNKIVDLCLKYNVRVRTVPPMNKWVKGELSLNQIREVNIEDLLGRKSIKLDNVKITSSLVGKSVLITGAAGSIGSEIVRQVVQYNPESIILLDQWETGLYEIDGEVRDLVSGLKIISVIADVSNRNRVEWVFEEYKPQVVFHAAAYKHVPMMENNPSEAILCNVLGTKNLADISIKHQVEKFVMISTDKAVNPTNVMGASKRIAEIYVQSLNNFLKANNPNGTSFITTRFGNVLGSNGSVIPLFKKQIAKGGPVTVTHPEITRYFMTIPEACQLVLEAGAMGNGGEIFIFDMGESVKIVDLAKKMIQLSGLEVGKDIDITFTGLRDGEKLYEELLNNNENTTATYHSKILIAKVREESYTRVKPNIEALIEAAFIKDDLNVVSLMKFIVPEFISNSSRFQVLDKHVPLPVEKV
jgi:FlaA1/EpsC-like NDP-sugar epimerase